MREHSFDAEESALRPKAARLEEPVPEHAARAAHAGRHDVLGPEAVLGLQRAVGNGGVTSMVESAGEDQRSPVHEVVGSGGRPLDAGVREDMEARLGHDFGDVRIHDDAAAHDSARTVNAHAYTVGSDIVFQRDTYDPGSDAGRVTLAHELTHVVQQRGGPVDGTPAPGGINVSDPGDRFEREAAATAEQAISGPPPAPAPATAAPTVSPAAVQRDVEGPEAGQTEDMVQRQEAAEEEQEEEPTVQGSFVQREETPTEEEEEEQAP